MSSEQPVPPHPLGVRDHGGGGTSPLRRLAGWLKRLSVGRKLMLIYLLDLTAVIYVSGILLHEKFESIDFTRKEIVGTAYMEVVRDMLLLPFMRGDVPAAQQPELVNRFERMRATHDETLHTREAAEAFSAAWQAAQAQSGAPLLARDATLRTLLRSGRELLTTVGNQSNLILDPDLDSYYAMSLTMLRFPELMEVLHDTRSALLAPPRAGGDRRAELLLLAGRIDAVGLGIRSDYAQAAAAGSPALRSALEPGRRGLDEQLLAFLGVVQRLADTGDQAGDEASRAATLGAILGIHGQTLQILDSAWLSTQRELDVLLASRVERLFSRMWLHIGTALLLLGCILSLVYVVARQIAGPLRRLADVADEVRRTGDHSRRASWDSSDEIGQLVTAFNGMLAQLDRERVVQQEMAASARAAQAQQELLEAMPTAMVVTAVPRHAVLHANAPAQVWLRGRNDDPWAKGLEPGVRARFFQHLADHGAVDEFEVRWLGGVEPSWAVLSARRLRFNGQDAVITAFTPINVLKVLERRLELWAKVFEASSEGIVIMDAQQRILSVNRAFCRSNSYDYYEVLGERLGMLFEDEAEHRLLPDRIAEAVSERDAWQGEVRFRKRSGETYPAWLMVSAVRESPKHGAVSHYIGISVDVTDRKRTEARVQFLAEHDVLTGLPNRALCVQRLREAVSDAEATGRRAAVLFIDLDRFKGINDTLGHHIGDGLLRSVAERLQQAVRAGDTVSRLGGDEFVVIMRNVPDAQEVQRVVEQRLIPLIRQAHDVEGHALEVSCSVGAAIYPDDGEDLDELMRRADAAMYQAKSAGRDTARFFVPEIDQLAQQRQTLERHLRHALERGEFSLHYQPRLDARSGFAVVGVEALLRWQQPELGPVSPAQFIGVAEESGLIVPIGRWVIAQACAQAGRWAQQGLGALAVSVNLSPAQLADPELVPHLQRCLADHGCAPHRLELEITESHLMENASVAIERLSALKALGVQLSVDDFGTGYSSLAYLKRFPIDKLKIDQSFVRDLHGDATDLAIVRAIIALGHTLGLTVVAEGVEQAAAAQRLQAMGCDELQGYHFARPMPVAALEAWLGGRVIGLESALDAA